MIGAPKRPGAHTKSTQTIVATAEYNTSGHERLQALKLSLIIAYIVSLHKGTILSVSSSEYKSHISFNYPKGRSFSDDLKEAALDHLLTDRFVSDAMKPWKFEFRG